jgi:hypothetical protein
MHAIIFVSYRKKSMVHNVLGDVQNVLKAKVPVYLSLLLFSYNYISHRIIAHSWLFHKKLFQCLFNIIGNLSLF